MLETFRRLSRTSRQLSHWNKREPSVAELASCTDMFPSQVAKILNIPRHRWSLNDIGEDESTDDFIDESMSVLNTVAFHEFQQKVDDTLFSLPEKEDNILRLRFGIGDGHPRTLEEVGSVFNRTRERIRQLESQGLRKLRHPTRSRALKSFINWKCEK